MVVLSGETGCGKTTQVNTLLPIHFCEATCTYCTLIQCIFFAHVDMCTHVLGTVPGVQSEVYTCTPTMSSVLLCIYMYR